MFNSKQKSSFIFWITIISETSGCSVTEHCCRGCNVNTLLQDEWHDGARYTQCRVPTVTCHMFHQRTHTQALLLGHSLQKCTQHLPSHQCSLWDHTHNLHMHHARPASPHCHIQPPSSPPTNPQYSSSTGQNKKHPLNSSPFYITDLSHLKKISCFSNHSASPRPPSSPSNKVCYCVSRDKSPAPTLWALLLPPSLYFHSPCGVPHSGPALHSHPCSPPQLHHTGTISL